MSFPRCLAFLLVMFLAGCASAPRVRLFNAFPLYDADRNEAASVRVNAGRGHGSGVVVGYKFGCVFLTAEHVIRGQGGRITLTLPRGDGSTETRDADLLAADPSRDLALLRTDLCDRARVNLAGDDEAAAGTYVYSVGYPAERGMETTRGRVRKNPFFVHMKPAEPADFDDGILADMDAEGGSSGCGVFAAATGNLVGVHKMSFDAADGTRSVLVSAKEIRRFLDANGISHE